MSCPATCEIADDYGDNHATMRCQLATGHDGPHREHFRGMRCLLLWHETRAITAAATLYDEPTEGER